MNSGESRRAPRRQSDETILVTDTMTDGVIGRIGNLSESGMLLIGHAPLVMDGLYQVRFMLSDENGRDAPIDLGMQLLWSEPHGQGQAWMGFRFISISPQHARRLQGWACGDAAPAG